MFEALKVELKKQGYVGILSGVRIPNFIYYRPTSSGDRIGEYISALNAGAIREPAFGAAKSSGAKLLGPIENYYDDPQSENWGLLMFHQLK